MKAETSPYRKPGRPATRKDKHGRPVPVRASRDQPLKFFFENVPRQRLDEAMQLSGDPRFFSLHDALQDPAYRNTTPATLCRIFGISLLDLFDLWRSYNVCLGMLHMATHLPEIMEDISVDALSRECMCPRCDGVGQVGEIGDERQCPMCQGHRTVRVPGDPDARRLVIEVMRRQGWQTR